MSHHRPRISILIITTLLITAGQARAQDIHCSARECHGTDALGNTVMLRMESGRFDATQRYTAQMGDDVIYIERKRSPIVSADWNGAALMQRPTTTITGTMNGQPVDLTTESSGLTTGNAFGKNTNCAVNGWSVFNPSPCF